MSRWRLHLGWSFCLVAVLALGLIALEYWRRQVVPQRPLLPVVFGHEDHGEVKCIDCHHNFVDGTGGGICYGCHKGDVTINYDMEEMFHAFCEGCHVEKRHEGEKSGPMRECSGCHADPNKTAG